MKRLFRALVLIADKPRGHSIRHRRNFYNVPWHLLWIKGISAKCNTSANGFNKLPNNMLLGLMG
jgi:hypothetical protein